MRPVRFIIAAALLAGVAPAAEAAPTPAAYVRIGQLGYEAGRPARAYLVTTASDAGAAWTVRDAFGQTAFTGVAPAPPGKWGPYFVTPLDFTLTRAGTYSLAVSGPLSAASASFLVAKPDALYSPALGRALSFYQTERDGPDYIPGALRAAPGHLNDASLPVYATPAVDPNDFILGALAPTGETINAAGGWWDAGDYMKYVETTSYTVGALLTGLRDFPLQLGPKGPADFTGEARFGLTWLARMWNDKTRTLYYQVGNSQPFLDDPTTLNDYSIWRLPQVDDLYGGGAPADRYITHRPVFAAGAAGAPISPNLAGRLAADFALCFIDYRKTDPAFARTCLTWAEHIYDQADPTPPDQLLTIVPFDGYPEVEWRDDMEWGATELYLALALGGRAVPAGLPHASPAFYLAQAASWAHAYITGPNDGGDTLNLYDVSGLAHFDLYRAIDLAGRPSGLAVSQGDLKADLLGQLSIGTGRAAADPFGYGGDWTNSDSAAYGIGLSVMAEEARNLGDASADWDAQSRRWMAGVLGANIWGVSFIVGDGAIFPACLQHQVANLAGSLNGAGLVLNGAVVEGPISPSGVASGYVDGMLACPVNGVDLYRKFTARNSRFEDNMQNYANTEPAIDLTALTPLMFAWRIAGQPKDLAGD